MSLGGEPALSAEEAEQAIYEGDEPDRSLIDDVEALIDDGKTYLQAELAFQKTRAAFVADGAKRVALFGVVAAVLVLLALVGLTVGLIIALTPLITAWGATALVVGVLLLVAFLLARSAGTVWRKTMSAAGSGNA